MSENPSYDEMFPGMAQWWLDHLDTAPLVVIRCGHRDPDSPRECRIAIGEVKADAGKVLAMGKNEYPEAETRWLPDPPTEGLSPAIAEELAAAIAERDAEVIRRYDDGHTVSKRQVWPRRVAPVEDLNCYVCRLHGEVEVDTADLAAFVAEALRDASAVTRTYVVRSVP